MLMLFILIAGALTLPRLKMEVFPDVNIDAISISVIYPGASPVDVEESICSRIEEQIHQDQEIQLQQFLCDSEGLHLAQLYDCAPELHQNPLIGQHTDVSGLFGVQ